MVYNTAGGFGDWSTRGCVVVSESEEDVICECDHLTNFAILLVSRDNNFYHAYELELILFVFFNRMYLQGKRTLQFQRELKRLLRLYPTLEQ